MSVEIPADSWWPFRAHPVAYEEAAGEGLDRGYGLVPSDGDTPAVLVDTGYYECAIFPVRLTGVDTPETIGTSGEELERAEKAERRTADLTKGKPVLVAGTNNMSFRRRLSTVYIRHAELHKATRQAVVAEHHMGGFAWASLADVLLQEDLADPYTEG